MLSRMFAPLAAAAFLSAGFGAAAPASAQDESRVAVPYGDLDLSKPSEAARLDRRLRTAARAACAAEPRMDPQIAAATAECEKTALARARGEAELASAARRTGTRVALNR